MKLVTGIEASEFPHMAILEGDQVIHCNDHLKWIRNRSTKDGKFNWKIAETKITDEIYVSTVFRGINHGFRGPPLWFETMVFPLCDICDRYETYAEAVRGHEVIVNQVRGIKELERE